MIETWVNEIEGNFSPPIRKRSYSFLMLNAEKNSARVGIQRSYSFIIIIFLFSRKFSFYLLFFSQPSFTLYSSNNSHSLTPVLFHKGGFEMKLKVKKCKGRGECKNQACMAWCFFWSSAFVKRWKSPLIASLLWFLPFLRCR